MISMASRVEIPIRVFIVSENMSPSSPIATPLPPSTKDRESSKITRRMILYVCSAYKSSKLSATWYGCKCPTCDGSTRIIRPCAKCGGSGRRFFGECPLRVLIVAISTFLLLLGNLANLAAVEFASAKSYPVGTNPSAIAVGDFNGDGKPDIAVANTGSSSVSILLGNGDGTFQPAVNFSAGNSPTAVAVGDFNADGKLDLAVLQPGDSRNSVAGSVSVLLGNGDGTFQAPKTIALTASAAAMAVADFNLDKKSDLAVSSFDASNKPGTLSIFLGNGDGTFQPAKQTSVPNVANGAFAAADFNGDSKPDVAVFTSAGILILLGNGDGTFLPGVTVAVALTPNSLLTGDFNHDARVDLFVRSSGFFCLFPGEFCANVTGLSAFLGNGDGSFRKEQNIASAEIPIDPLGQVGGTIIDSPAVGDFNGDGKLDVAYRRTSVFFGSKSTSTSLEIRLGKGDGTFSPAIVLSDPGPGVITEDLNADKLSDLIGLGTTNDIAVLLNTSPTSGADVGILSSGASANRVGVGTNLTYTADVLNQGPTDATGVVFTDTLPNNVNFVSATASQGSCAQSHGIVSCTMGSLASAFDSTVSIVVTPTVTGTITNLMGVAANEPDPVPANNTATQTTTVVPVFTLTVTKTGNGSGKVFSDPGLNGAIINCGTTCSATYLSGTGVSVGEIPDANSLFASWGGACSGNRSCFVIMDADKSVTANFVLGMRLTVSLAGSGSGSVTSNDGAINCASSGGTCSSLYLPGTSVSLTAAPAGTSVFGGWSDACTGTDPRVCSITLNSSQSVTAAFNPPPDFTLTSQLLGISTQTGMQVTDTLTLTGQNGFSGAVTLSCAVTGPAPLATCQVSPSPVMLGSSPGTATLTITAPATLAALALPLNECSRSTVFAVVLPFPALLVGGIGLASRKFRKRKRGLWLLGGSAIVLFTVLAGCGGGTTTPSPQNYAVTVTATSGSLQHSTVVRLTVQ